MRLMPVCSQSRWSRARRCRPTSSNSPPAPAAPPCRAISAPTPGEAVDIAQSASARREAYRAMTFGLPRPLLHVWTVSEQPHMHFSHAPGGSAGLWEAFTKLS